MGIYSSTYLFAVKGGQLIRINIVGDRVGLILFFEVFFCNPTQHDTQLLCLIVSCINPSFVFLVALVLLLNLCDGGIHGPEFVDNSRYQHMEKIVFGAILID